jgi:hypothetical protein
MSKASKAKNSVSESLKSIAQNYAPASPVGKALADAIRTPNSATLSKLQEFFNPDSEAHEIVTDAINATAAKDGASQSE